MKSNAGPGIRRPYDEDGQSNPTSAAPVRYGFSPAAAPTLVSGGEPPFFAQDLRRHHGARHVAPGDVDGECLTNCTANLSYCFV